jgi:hypothetical protein
LDNPKIIFGSDRFSKIPEIAVTNINEACKCIVFDRSTAAAFHLLRGVEATLNHLYECCIKRNRIKDRNWGVLTRHLEKRGVVAIELIQLLARIIHQDEGVSRFRIGSPGAAGFGWC